VAAYSHTHSGIRSIKDLNPHMLKEIEAFFGNYQQLAGVRFKALGRKGPARAMKLVKNALRANRR
jgi:inorganic pyrophosphatase